MMKAAAELEPRSTATGNGKIVVYYVSAHIYAGIGISSESHLSTLWLDDRRQLFMV
jgi:hypothetical protein